MDSSVLFFKNSQKLQQIATESEDVKVQKTPQTVAGIETKMFTVVYEANYKRVYNYISYRINNHNDTEDLVSQVFCRVLQKYASYNPKLAPLEAWIIGIAKNCVADYFRKQKKQGNNVALDKVVSIIAGDKQPDEIIVVAEKNKKLISALDKLKAKERHIVALKYAAELKNVDIAQIMEISENNVGVILHRSLKKLKNMLAEEA